MQIRSLPGAAVISNGIGPPVHSSGKSKAPLPPRQNDNHLPTHHENEEEAARSSDGSDQPANPRGGVIGRTPTPPSAPTPVYEKDQK